MVIGTGGVLFMKRYSTFLLILTFALLLGYSAWADEWLVATPMTAFQGGTFEASGVAYVPGTDGVLFVDDGRPDEIFWMQIGEDRKQAGPIKESHSARTSLTSKVSPPTERTSTLSALSRSPKAATSRGLCVSSSTRKPGERWTRSRSPV